MWGRCRAEVHEVVVQGSSFYIGAGEKPVKTTEGGQEEAEELKFPPQDYESIDIFQLSKPLSPESPRN